MLGDSCSITKQFTGVSGNFLPFSLPLISTHLAVSPSFSENSPRHTCVSGFSNDPTPAITAMIVFALAGWGEMSQINSDGRGSEWIGFASHLFPLLVIRKTFP